MTMTAAPLFPHLNKEAQIIIINPPFFSLHHPPSGIAYVEESLVVNNIRTSIADLNIAIVNRFRHTGRKQFIENYWRHSLQEVHHWQEDFHRSILPEAQNEFNQAAEELAAHPAQMIAFSVNTLSLKAADLLCDMIRNRTPDKVIIYGGYACSHIDICRNLSAAPDYICVGEGERAAVQWAKAVIAGKDPGKIPGIMENRNDASAFAPRGPVDDLDRIPWPKWNGFDLSLYRVLSPDIILPVNGSRGCSWGRCLFCSDSKVQNGFRHRSADSLLEEIIYHVQRNHVRTFSFTDLAVNGDAKELEHFCDLLIEAGIEINFFGQFHIDKHLTPKLLKKLKAAGLMSLNFGLETGSGHVMQLMRKGYNVSLAERCLKNGKQASHTVSINLIAGFPGESPQHVEETCQFLQRNRDYIDTVEMLLPCYLNYGSPLYDDNDRYGVCLEKHLSLDPIEDWRTFDGKNTGAERRARVAEISDCIARLGLKKGGFFSAPNIYPLPGNIYLSEAFCRTIQSLDRYDRVRVLVVRSCPIERMTALLEALGYLLKGISFDLLVQRDVAAAFENQENIKTCHIYSGGPLNTQNVSKKTIQTIISTAYDWIVVPYGEMPPMSYIHILELVRQLSPKRMLVVSKEAAVTIESPLPVRVIRDDDIPLDREGITKAFSKVCPAPWMTLVVHPGGDFTPCCWMAHGGDHQNIKTFSSLEEIWNSPYFKNLRRLISQHQYQEAGCPPDCFYLNNRNSPPYEGLYYAAHLTDAFIEKGKHEKLIRHFLNRDMTLSSLPAMMHTVVFYDCNLSCFMCVQQIPRKEIKSRLSMDDLSMLLGDKTHLSTWVVFGGEVLIDNEFIEFFSRLELRKIDHLHPIITTNGLLLKKSILEKLTETGFPFLIFSIDGVTPQTYQKIRKGGNYRTAMNNFKRALEYYRKHDSGHKISWSYILMNSTLGEIEDAIRQSTELGVHLNIEKIVGPFPDENLFDFPHHNTDPLKIDQVIRHITILKNTRDSALFRLATIILPAIEEVRSKITKVDTFLSSAPDCIEEQLIDLETLNEIIPALFARHRKPAILEHIAKHISRLGNLPQNVRLHYLIIAAQACDTAWRAELYSKIADLFTVGAAFEMETYKSSFALLSDGLGHFCKLFFGNEIVKWFDIIDLLLNLLLREIPHTVIGGNFLLNESQCRRLIVQERLEALFPFLAQYVDLIVPESCSTGNAVDHFRQRLFSWIQKTSTPVEKSL